MLKKERIIQILNEKPDISFRTIEKKFEDEENKPSRSYFFRVKKQWRKQHKRYELKSENKSFKQQILTCLFENPSGLTITDISDEINASRNTVSKYLGILEAKKKVKSRKIGAYSLYYARDRSFIPKRVMLSYYIGLLKGLKDEITDKEKFKSFGRTIADFMEFPYGSQFPDYANPQKGASLEDFFQFLGTSLVYIDFIYESKPTITPKIFQNGAEFIIDDIELFDKSTDFDVHYYIASGVIERIISSVLKKQVTCSVGQIDVDSKKVVLKIIVND